MQTAAQQSSLHVDWNFCSINPFIAERFGNDLMQKAVERIMQTYDLLTHHGAEENRATLERLLTFLAEIKDDDEHRLVVEGLRYLHETGSL